MRKAVFALLSIVFSAVFIIAGTFAAFAAEPIDTERLSSLSLQYKQGEKLYGGLEIKAYRIADVFDDGTYALCDDFSEYPVNIYGITTQTEWRRIASTLAAYAVADKIEPHFSAVTDEEGRVAFSGLVPGMYLTLSVRALGDEGIAVFESFVTAVPYPDESGHIYDVSAFPKCEEYIPAAGKTEHKVVKQWKDSGYTSKRPEFVTVDILKDGELFESVKLSEKNNWSYTWSAEDDGSVWQAVERDIPIDYTMTVVENQNTYIITNAVASNGEDAPQTGDTFVVWPYALGLAFSGGAVMIFAAARGKKERS
ncbi:MAG: Cna B-type domain-containing protein [Ruminococcaceae bacterium]|nr:Cna B-type domain-containing protein [Oscillospiraceae bacterium]